VKPSKKFAASAAFVLLLAGTAAADTLELKDGRVLQGRFLGGTQAVMRFEWNGEVKTFSVNDIVALTFTANYHERDNAVPPVTSQDSGPPPPLRYLPQPRWRRRPVRLERLEQMSRPAAP